MADFEELHGVGFDFNPNCNVWYRIKANIIDSVDDLKASEEDKVRLRKKLAGIVGIPVFMLVKTLNMIRFLWLV